MNRGGNLGQAQNIIGEASEFLLALEHASRAAALSKPVLILGERGTGKELFASRIHFLSPRWDQPLVKVNCAALTESILESELFGHEAGSFTGASNRHVGRFERADNGTLLLDELGTISARMQEKILRVIEYGEFERVGGTETIQVDVRIVGATNANLPELAAQNKFRSDLLDRLAFDVVWVPPLRHRRSDILLLANHFAVGITSELGRPFFAGFTEEAQLELLDYAWPGNVRELKNAVERSVYRSQEQDEEVDELIINPFESHYAQTATLNNASVQSSPETQDGTIDEADQDFSRQSKLAFPMDLKNEVANLEQLAVREALAQHRFHQGHAATALGLTYHQFRAYIKKFDIDVKSRD